MQFTKEFQHDEINLVRLVRRFEKSVANAQEWEDGTGENQAELWLKAQKDLQKVKHARKLIKNVESYETEVLPERIKRLNDIKIKVDRVEEFLKDQAKRNVPPVIRPEPLLPRLPIPPTPEEKHKASSGRLSGGTDNAHAISSSLNPLAPSSPHLYLPADDLLLSPPDFSSLPSASLISALPALLPEEKSPTPTKSGSSFGASTSTSRTTAFDFGSTATARKPQGTQAHASLHEELSAQLEHMAAQLKRNAVHFADSLAKDKAVVEAAGEKLEQNYDVMLNKTTLLKDLRGKSGSTTWLTVGIVVVVLLVFMMMVSVIRFSRL